MLKATESATEDNQPVLNVVNGFNLSVIPSESTTNLSLKRRQAIARNPSGVIMLRGEESFSSNDQILIDELAFYIKQNNLTVSGIPSSGPQQIPSSTPISTTSTSVSTGTGGSISGGGGGGGY